MANPGAAVATLRIDSWEHPFSRRMLAELGALLPDFLSARRWFRSKARSIREVEIEDVLEAEGAWILLLQVAFADGGADRYLLPVAFTRGADFSSHAEILATVAGPVDEPAVLHSALSDAAFRAALLQTLAHNGAFRGSQGDLIAQRTRALEAESGLSENLESTLVKAEQSNTSIIYGDRCILKLFRKLEAGVNPDAEIGIFLTERGFRHTPQVLGTLEYRTHADIYSAGILQQFVKNRGDAWATALEVCKEALLSRSGRFPPDTKSSHPLDLRQIQPSAEIRDLLGDFAGRVRLLGRRTAQMHAALCDSVAGPDFVPEPFAHEAVAKAHAEMMGQADIAFELVRRRQAGLPEDVAASARDLLRLEDRVGERFARFCNLSVTALRIRHHGDFHLGQVLDTGGDFMIIDFEGEPSRPVADRRAKALALRDVAGMIRSFQYAAYASLFEQFPNAAAQRDLFSALESWAICWSAWASAFYTGAYFEAADPAFAGATEEERRVLLDAFLLEKVLYEIGYEWNNRPDWVRIPLRGALSLLQ